MKSLITAAAASLVTATAMAQPAATVVVQENDGLVDFGTLGIVSGNGAGGYAVLFENGGLDVIYGNATGPTGGAVLLDTTDVFGTFGTAAFFDTSIGLSNAGVVSAQPNFVDGDNNDGDAVSQGTTVLAEQGSPGPFAGTIFTSPLSGVVSSDNGVTYYQAEYGPVGGSTSGGTAQALMRDNTVVLNIGDVVAGAAGPESIAVGAFVFAPPNTSESGNSYITEANLNAPSSANSAIIVDGAIALMSDGVTELREGDVVAAGVGGDDVETFTSGFDLWAVNDAGDIFLNGNTTADNSMDEVLIKNGQIFAREGEAVSLLDGSSAGTLTGSVTGLNMNAQGDTAVLWGVTDAADLDGDANTTESLEVLMFNGEVLFSEGQAVVDNTGDGVADGLTLDDIDSIGATNFAVSISDRLADGTVNIYFNGNVGGQGGEAVFVVNVPEPTTAALVGLGGLAMLRRRRSA